MLLFRKFLVRIRQEYRVSYKRFFLSSGAVALILILIGFAVDGYLPFNGVFNIMRSLLLIPSSFAIFTIAYGVGLFFHGIRINSNPEWIPYRSRWSPSWRRRFGAIFGAFLLVIIITSGRHTGYTFINSIVGAGIIAIVAFIRLTKVEEDRSNLGIPNVQDLQFDSFSRLKARQRSKPKNASPQQKNKKASKSNLDRILK
jgi:hypothetical protein